MSDLTEFLLARISEDQAVGEEALAQLAAENDRIAKRYGDPPQPPFDGFRAWPDEPGPGVCIISPARVLAECEAKRHVVEMFTSAADWAEHPDCSHPDMYRLLAGAYLESCQYLALPYADHPSYDESWRL